MVAASSRNLLASLLLILSMKPVRTYSALVSGAGGFLGSEIVWQLLEGGHQVRATVRSVPPKHLLEWQVTMEMLRDIRSHGCSLRCTLSHVILHDLSARIFSPKL
jgi:nucleoside-diphosphate-sugar epimerase